MMDCGYICAVPPLDGVARDVMSCVRRVKVMVDGEPLSFLLFLSSVFTFIITMDGDEAELIIWPTSSRPLLLS